MTHARRQMRLGVDPDYDLVAAHFDHAHYVLAHPGTWDQPGVDLIEHFLAEPRANRSPTPHFSTGAFLENNPPHSWSGERHPYLAWLKRGKAAGQVADPAPRISAMAGMLGMSSERAVELLVQRRADVIDRLLHGELGEMYRKATRIEPLIGRTSARFTRPRLFPFGHPQAIDQAAAIHAAHETVGFRRARLLLVVNRPRWGGGRRMEGHIAHALARSIDPDDIVVVYADGPGGGAAPAGRFPDGVRELDFAALVADLEPEEQQVALVLLLRTFQADAIVNLNSATLYHAMQSLGKALARSERIFLCFFCNEQMPIGAWTGWSLRFFYRLYEQVAGVFTDSEFLAAELLETHRVPMAWADRLQVLRAPVDASVPLASEPPPQGRRPQVYWAGRWVRQKRLGLLCEIAEQMPDVDFRMWGEPVRGGHVPPMPDNVIVEGRYRHISHIPLDDADAWLYTSAWDGVPSQLLEVGMTGIPLVGTLVGGTGEVLLEGHAWRVPEDAGADAYVAALRQVLADPGAARQRAVELRERLLAERTESAFAEHVARVLLLAQGREQEEAV
ncbi:MAG: glycosyltransferase family 4 protein [Nocardioidaceae bacterium]